MTESALDRVLLASDPVSRFNTEVVRAAWNVHCDRRRTAVRQARSALEAVGALPSAQSLAEEDPVACSYVKQLWTDHLIVETGEEAGTYRVPFTVSSPGTSTGDVSFGAPTRVVETYVAAARSLDMDLCHLSADELAAEWARLLPLAGSSMALAGPPVAERRKLAEEDKAMSDGSYPIPNVAYLKKAIRALGRAKDYNKALRWIKKRARALGQSKLVEHLKPRGAG